MFVWKTTTKTIITEITPDQEPRLWALYLPEPEEMISNRAPIHLWVRRVELFISEVQAKTTLDKRISQTVVWVQHELFPELQIGTDARRFHWFLEPVPITTVGTWA